jgi:hypothetical protein
MTTSVPHLESPPPTHHGGQTGPRTAAGKARSSMNAVRHGLTARSLVIPGEDPDDYEQFMNEMVDSLAPAGAAEIELARVAASSFWKLRRSDRWMAAQARIQADREHRAIQDQVAELDKQIDDHRGHISHLQIDPVNNPPLLLRLAELPDTAEVDVSNVSSAVRDWRGQFADRSALPTFNELCQRIGLPRKAVRDPTGWNGWNAGHLRLLVAEFARARGMTPEEYVKEARARWEAGLPDERAIRRRERSQRKQQIQSLELRKQDLLVNLVVPESVRLDLVTKYESAAMRRADKAMKTLHVLQDARRRARRSKVEPEDLGDG